MSKMNTEILTMDEIKKQFPDEWILLRLPDSQTGAITPSVGGVVLWHSKDYLELCYKGSEIAKNILTKIFFTGEQTSTRKWLKATRLKEQPKTI